MKNNWLRVYLLGILLFYSSLSYPADSYTIDPNHSYILFHINHLGFSNQVGKWYVAEGTLELDQKQPQKSQVNAIIHVEKIATGHSELDQHLKEPLFFDITKFPNATFVSDKVTVTGKKTAKVHGILTLHGVSKPVTLDVTLNKMGINPIDNKESVGFSATTTIKRSDFDMKTLLPQLGDEVKLNIEAEAKRNNANP